VTPNNQAVRDLYRMAVFAKVVEQGSFTAAARALGIGKSAVSQHLSTLEDDLGVRLLNRSTRSLHLTDEGRRFYSACQHMVDTATHAVSDLETAQEAVSGVVRVTASYNLGTTFLPPCLRAFRAKYPRVVVELVLDDSIRNVIEEGFDLALRVSWRRDSSLYARKLCGFRMVLCGARDYVAAHARLRRPEDVLEHPWIAITRIPHPERLDLRNAQGQHVSVKLSPAVRTNTGIAARELVRVGVGIGVVPEYAIRDELHEGAFVELLPEWRASEGAVHAVSPHREHMSVRTKRLVELLVDEVRRQSAPFARRGNIAANNRRR
jgi:DNA-binding transcriptional LysR family regulator